MLPFPLDLTFREAEQFFLVLTRIASFLIVVPVFGAPNSAPQVKVGFAVVLSILIYPLVPAARVDVTSGLPGFIELVLKEVFTGLVLGMITQFVFVGVQFAGELIGIQIGFSMVSLMDPTQETNLSIVGQLYFAVAMLLFLIMDGHHRWIEALLYSYRVVPPGAIRLAVSSVMQHWIGMTANIFIIGLKIAAPVMATLFLTDTALGLLSRSAEQLNIFSVGFAAKIVIGLFALSAGFPLFAYAFGKLFAQFLRDFELYLGMMRV